ncbi:MAG: M48 family metallopeptidase [Armatimonadetes bacterium]|nr:M48 family metallopeptidase [Armatimonadota bacterium]
MKLALRLAVLVLAITFLVPSAQATNDELPADQVESTPSTANTAEEPTPPAPELSPEEKRDAEIGQKAAEEIEKQYKVLEESPELPRITAVVETIEPSTEKPHQHYRIKVIDSKAVNAFSLPGGYLYFTQGILEAVESDDELAAVAAHEMAHVCLNHSRRLMSRDEKYRTILGALLVASVLSNSEAVDSGAIATVGSLVAQDALNHYGREAEFEADRQAVRYLHASQQYHPVAVLTVVEGLARMEASEGSPELGVYQTHPYGPARVQAVINELTELGVPIERRRVIRSLVAAAEVVVQNDVEIGRLKLNEHVVFEPAVAFEGSSPAARAEQSATVMNDLLLGNLQLLELVLTEEQTSVSLLARGETVFTITQADAEFHGVELRDLARQAMEAIQLAFREEKVARAY